MGVGGSVVEELGQLGYCHSVSRVLTFPDSLFSTAEMSDDCMSKFASLVHSGD